jgi:hypothetical protein
MSNKSNRKNSKHSIEKHPDFNFKKIDELDHLSFPEKEKLLFDIEYILGECELSRKSILQEYEMNNFEIDPDWLKRVNYKIGVKKHQRRMLQNHLRIEKGRDLMGSFFDVAKIMLPEETFESILKKAKDLNNKVYDNRRIEQ